MKTSKLKGLLDLDLVARKMEIGVILESRQRMEKVIKFLKDDLSTIRTGRATPSLVEDIKVWAYQSQMRLLELAHITVPEFDKILIKPYDPGNGGNIRKAILEANLGLNPVIDGDVIRVYIPPLTEEGREKLSKIIGQKLEGARVLVRQVRQEVMEKIERAFEGKEISEDERFRLREQIQKVVEEFNDQIEKLGEKKRLELMKI